MALGSLSRRFGRTLLSCTLSLCAAAAFAAESAPSGPPPGGKEFKIPAESYAACKGKAVDATCSFTDSKMGKTLSGTCVAPPNSSSTDSLSCRPARPEGGSKPN
jgi:hypothetical protein